MKQCIAGIFGSARQVVQGNAQNLCDIVEQIQTGLSRTAFNMTDGFNRYTNLSASSSVLISFAFRAERTLCPIRIALISIVIAPFSFSDISIN